MTCVHSQGIVFCQFPYWQFYLTILGLVLLGYVTGKIVEWKYTRPKR